MRDAYCDECGEDITNRFKMVSPQIIKDREWELSLNLLAGNNKWKKLMYTLICALPIISPYHLAQSMCFCNKKCALKYSNKQKKRMADR